MKDLFYYLSKLERYKSNPNFMKKVILWGSLALGGLFVLLAVAIWGAVSLFSAATSTASKMAASPAAQSYADSLKSDLQDLPRIKALPCFDTAQNLLALGPWLERPVLDNMVQLKDACLAADRPSSEEETNGRVNTPP